MSASLRVARLLSPLALLALCAGSASPPRYAERLKEFQARAAERRKTLGYTQAQVDALFPTPRIALTGPKVFPAILPGQTGRIQALFTPPLAEGALVAFDCDGVSVSNFKQTATSLDATVAVPMFHLPRTCSLLAHQPVSLRNGSVPAFRVDGTYVWSLTLSNKMTVRWRSRADQSSEQPVPSTWQLGATTKEYGILIEQDGEGGRFLVEPEHTDHDEEIVTIDPRDTPVAKMRAYEAQAAALGAKVEACERLPRRRQLDCASQYNSQVQDLLARRASLTERPKQRVHKTHAVVCEELVLDAAQNGKVTGTAEGCPDGRSATVTGTVTVVAEP